MFAVLLAVALGGWGQSGGCPGGVCPMPGPGMPFFPQQPQWVQIQGPVAPMPPIQSPTPSTGLQSVTGKVVGLEVVGPDGRRLFYPFAGDLTVTLKYDPATSVVSEANIPQGKDAVKGQGCPNADCCCDPCKCKKCECPKTPDAAPQPLVFEQQVNDSIPNYGIDQKKMAERKGRIRYSTNGGREISKQESTRLLAATEGIPDDSGYDSLTIIGTKDDCRKVQTDVDSNPAFAPVRDKLLVQCYEPTDDMVKDKGFAAGSPSIYLQDNKGHVKYRWASYAGPEKTAGEINKRRPDYDPSKDPNPNSPSLPSLPNLQNINPMWLAVALFGFLLFKK